MTSIYVSALGVSVASTAGLGVLTWRRRSEPGAKALAILLLSILFWAAVYAVALVTHSMEWRLVLQRVLWAGVVTAPVAWFVFALQYTGHGDRVTWGAIAVLSAPSAVVLGLVWTNPLHGLVWRLDQLHVTSEGIALLSLDFGLVFWLFVAYTYALVMAGVVYLLRLVFTAEHLFIDQAFALVVGALVPLVVNLLSLSGLSPQPGLNLTPYAFAVSGATFSYALFQADLLRRVPATRRIGRTAIVRHMHDGVIVLDEDDVVVDVNRTALQQFGRERSALLGRPVEAVLDDDFVVPDAETTAVWSAAGPREYEIQTSALTDQHDRSIGRVLVIRDITDRTNRRQQLQVLNRVLRHNFRNDMNVIDVCATQLSDRLTGEDAELADRIRMVARDLAETSTKAREIERIMSRRHEEAHPVDVSALVERQLDRLHTEHPDVTVETDVPTNLQVRSTGILESALRNVLENAVRHNDAADPRIRVAVETCPSGDVEIAVADNGPGIPEQEREVLVKGTETPLEHGSGLGLWLVNWAVTMLGGEVSFEDNDPRGSVVTIRLSQSRAAAAAETGASPVDAR